MKFKFYLKNLVRLLLKMGVVTRNRNRKLVVSEERINRIDWLFACCHKSRKAESYLNNVWLGVVKKGCDYSGHRTRKLVLSQEGIDRINRFFCILSQIQESSKLIQWFLGGSGQKSRWSHLGHETQINCISRINLLFIIIIIIIIIIILFIFL